MPLDIASLIPEQEQNKPFIQQTYSLDLWLFLTPYQRVESTVIEHARIHKHIFGNCLCGDKSIAYDGVAFMRHNADCEPAQSAGLMA